MESEDCAIPEQPDWPFSVGDRVLVTQWSYSGKSRKNSARSVYRGKVVSVHLHHMVIDTGRYRITVLWADWFTGEAEVKLVRPACAEEVA